MVRIQARGLPLESGSPPPQRRGLRSNRGVRPLRPGCSSKSKGRNRKPTSLSAGIAPSGPPGPVRPPGPGSSPAARPPCRFAPSLWLWQIESTWSPPFIWLMVQQAVLLQEAEKKLSCPRLRQAQRVFPAPIIAEDSRPRQSDRFPSFSPSGPGTPLRRFVSFLPSLPCSLFFFYNPPFFLLSFLL